MYEDYIATHTFDGEQLTIIESYTTKESLKAAPTVQLIAVSSALELATYGFLGKITAVNDVFGQPVSAHFHESFIFQNEEGSVELLS